MRDFPIFPEQASTFAGQIDGLYWLLVGLSLLFGGVLPFIILYLMVRYHRSQKVDRSNQIHGSIPLELTWTIIPLLLVMGVFFWGAFLYVQMRTMPQQALEVYVIGKQWMWHAQHPNGKRENNELHVPIGQPVKLIMTSQDVIHSFYIPAFRVKQDVLPGRYTTMWFEATKEGEYHLFCAEYCGTEHSKMVGRVVAMSLAEYELWLTTPGEIILPDGSIGAGGVLTTAPSTTSPSLGDPMAAQGEQLFANLGCAGCHRDDGAGVGPSLRDVYGYEQELADGTTVLADENYIRESILNPGAKVAAGYGPVMPAYEGQVSDDQINQLIAYLKSKSARGATAPAGETTGGEAGATAEPAATGEATAAATSAAAEATATSAPDPTATGAASVPTATAPAATATSAAPTGGGGGAFDAALAAQGEQIFTNLGCVGCHNPAGGGIGPSLVGVYNTPQPLEGGGSAVADEAYLIESILNPSAQIVQGYQPIMPPYQGQLSDDQLSQLVEYIKSLGE